ncbi:hypothetical protein [Sedimenticola sp.]|uniref:hypothetical protein n=1 Tax=Sedimenticola sp. TaxID=1940285 RepID=UPI003D116633
MAIRKLQLWLQLTRSHGIIRRYFVVNGFDGALTMLGLITGFYLSSQAVLEVVISACLGAAIALAISGVSSAYLSETAERRKALADLEEAMVADLSESAHANAARVIPLLIAIVNGAAPLLMSLIIISPLLLVQSGVEFSPDPLLIAITTAFVCIFGLGAFLGNIGGTSWWLSGIKTMAIALTTVVLILLIEQ